MSSNAVVEGVSGSIGAVVALLATYPLLTITTKRAVDSRTSASQTPKPLAHEIQQIYRDGGVGAFFAGLQPAFLGTLVSQGLYFYLYAELRQVAVGRQQRPQQSKPELSVVKSLAVASAAGCGNVVVTTPIWLAVTRLQAAASGSRRSFAGELREIYREGGVAALWRGVVPSLVMVCNPTIQYVLYELSVRLWKQRRRKQAGDGAQVLSSSEVFLLSAVAKLGATLITYPLLVVKNRIQAMKASQRGRGKQQGFARLLVSILRKEGFLGLFAGLQAKVVQSVVAAALMFMLKERLHNVTAHTLGALSSVKGREHV